MRQTSLSYVWVSAQCERLGNWAVQILIITVVQVPRGSYCGPAAQILYLEFIHREAT